MYNHNIAPMTMGVGGSWGLSFLGMSWFWVVLALFALIACCSAIRRVLPKVMIVTNNDAEPTIKRHARL